ncbi:MAG: hypothetical protein IPK03_13350 [Bacteroidetes bacterium]|nr:hypothetical protein [Bacteroidota bacterium]
MDNTGKIIKESVKEFSDQFVNSMRSVKKGFTVKDKGGDLGISNNFLIKDLKARPDGGAFLLAEEFNSFTVSTSDGRGGRTYISTYIYGDKFVCGIDPNGQFEWLVNIPTNMIYDRPDIGTYVSFLSQDKLYLIYSDNEDNLKQKLNQRPIDNTKLKKVSTAIVSIDNKTGKAERNALIDSKDEKFLLLPNVSANINNELFILGGKFGMYQVKEYRIARISVK